MSVDKDFVSCLVSLRRADMRKLRRKRTFRRVFARRSDTKQNPLVQILTGPGDPCQLRVVITDDRSVKSI